MRRHSTLLLLLPLLLDTRGFMSRTRDKQRAQAKKESNRKKRSEGTAPRGTAKAKAASKAATPVAEAAKPPRPRPLSRHKTAVEHSPADLEAAALLQAFSAGTSGPAEFVMPPSSPP